jgi:riboflavin transporter FmnP
MGSGLRRSVAKDIKWGLVWGLWLAAAFGLLGSFLFLLQGTVLGQPSRFSFPLVILGYFAMGLTGGVLAGLMRPLTRWRLGATLMGALIGIVVYAIATIIAVGEENFRSTPGLISTFVLGTGIGGFLGYSMWTKYQRETL